MLKRQRQVWHGRRRMWAIMLALALLGALLPGAVLAAPAETVVAHEYGCAFYHTVRRGQTLSGIARYYGVSLHALAQANGIRNWNHIYRGQKLCIPGGYHPAPPPHKPPPPPPPPHGCAYYHRVSHGDTLAKIAWRYGTTTWVLMQANGLANPNYIYVGQLLCIPGYYPPPPPPPKPPPPPSGKWLGAYFNNKFLSGPPVFTRNDVEINFNWGGGAPGGGISEDNFSVVWTRDEYFQAGTYRFFATSDDGVRVYVDNQLVIDGWRIQPATSYFGDIYLNDGYHHIRVEYFEESGVAGIVAYWGRL